MLSESAAPQISLAPVQHTSDWVCPEKGSSAADPASTGGSRASGDTGAPPPMPIARFDPSLVAAVKCATEILQADDGWSKEEAAATIAVLAKKFQNSKRRTGQTSDTTARSGEGSIPMSQPDQPQAQGLQHEQALQSSPWTPTAGLDGNLSGQQQPASAGAAPLPHSAAVAAAGRQGSRLGPLLADFGKALCTPGTPGQSMPTEPAAGGAATAGDVGTTLPESAPAIVDTGTLLQSTSAAAGGVSNAGHEVGVPGDRVRDTALARVASNARGSPADIDTPAHRSDSPDAASGSITGQQQHADATMAQHCAGQHTAAAEDGSAGQRRTDHELGSGCKDTAGRDSANNLATAAVTTQACQPPGTVPGAGAPAGRRQLDAASAAAVAAAAMAASKIAATADVTGFAASDILSDDGAIKPDPELPVDLGMVMKASSPPVAEGSSSCAEPSGHRSAGMAAAETAATSARTAAERASQCLIGSLEDVLAQSASQPGGGSQVQLPLALIQLLQSGQPQALPLMSALLRYGNLRPLVADAFKVRLSTYLQQQRQGANATKHGSCSEATGAAEAQAEVGDAGGAAADPSAAALQDDPTKKQTKQPLLGACSESRSATSTAAGSQASADLGATETAVKRKRVRQPSAKAISTAAASNATCSERPLKRPAKDHTAADAGAAAAAVASAAASAVPVQPAVANRPKRGRPAKNAKVAGVHAGTGASPDAHPRGSGSLPAAAQLPAAQAFDSSSMPVSVGGLTALLTEDIHPAALGGQPFGSTGQHRGPTAASPKVVDLQQQSHQPLQVHQMYDTSCIADCPMLLERLSVLPHTAVQQVLDMASKLPVDMPQHWKRTVLLQAADSAVNVLQLQHVPQPLQQQQHIGLIPSAVAAELPTLHNLGHLPAAGSTTATPAPDAAATGSMPLLANPSLGATPANTVPQVLAQAGNTPSWPADDWAILPGLMAAAETHPRLRTMSADKREALLKQLLKQHQGRQAKGMQAMSEQMQQPLGLLQANSLPEPGHTSSLSGGAQVPWNAAFAALGNQATPSAAATSFGPLGFAAGNSSCAAGDMSWLQGISGVHLPPGTRQQQQQNGAACPGYLSDMEQQAQALMDPTCSRVFSGALAGSVSGVPHLDVYSVGIGSTTSAAAADAVAPPTGGTGLSGSGRDSSHLQGLMGGTGPGMRQQYMERLQQQLELHGMNKKQLVDLMKQQGAVAALRSTGMLSHDLQGGRDSTPGALTAPETAEAMDPALAAELPSDQALTVEQRQQARQQQPKLGPYQQAWLQLQQQQAAGCVTGNTLPAMLAQQHWHGGAGLQQQGAQAELSMPPGLSAHGADNKHGLENSLSAGLGMAGGSAGGILAADAGGGVLQDQQHLALSSAMPSLHQMPHQSLGLAQQQLMMHLQHPSAAHQLQHLNAATSAALAWGAVGAGLQQAMSSSAALDPPVLQLPNLSPVKVSQAAAAAAAKASHLLACPGMSAAVVSSAGAGGAGGQHIAKPAAASGLQQGEGQGACTRSSHAVSSAQLLQPLDLHGSLGELGATDEDGIAVSPFGQLGLNAADVDALLSGFDPHAGLC